MLDLIKIAIVSRNEIIREGLRRILEDEKFCVDIVDLEDLPTANSAEMAALILVDAVDVCDGLSVCEPLRLRYPLKQLVLMVDECGASDVAQAFASGAVDGYLIKQISCGSLGSALRLIAMGEKLVPTQFINLIGSPILQKASHSIGPGTRGLSSRELQILSCLIDGDANKIISRRLNIADATVKVHIKAILRKLHVENRTQAAVWAFHRGFIGNGTEPQLIVA